LATFTVTLVVALTPREPYAVAERVWFPLLSLVVSRVPL
jgi:hypothetical protein